VIAGQPKKLLFRLNASAALLCVGTFVHAQETPDNEAQQSRISPEHREPGAPVSPPVLRAEPPRMSTPRPDEHSLKDALAKSVTAEGFIEGVRLCMAAVSPRFDVHPQVLSSAGWAYTSPQRVPSERGTIEAVQFFKDQRVIALQDYGKLVLCAVAGRIEKLDQMYKIRAALIDTLGAVPIDKVPRLRALVAHTRANAPQTDFSNVLIAGDYSLEIFGQQRDLGKMATPSIKTISMVKVTSAPLPAEFQSYAQSGATK
jgi:hypothetical protein